MRSRIALSTVCWLLAGAPGVAQAQDSIEVEDVKLALANATFQSALGACFKSTSRPDEVTLVLLVQAQGETQLTSAEDEIDPATTTCISKATTHLTMPATGSHFQITVTVPVPAPASTLTIKKVDAPPPVSTTSAPPVVAPTAIPLVASPAVPIVAHPVATKPPTPPEPTPEWKIRYSKGRKRIIGGVVALGAGLQFALVGGAGFLGTMPLMCNSSRYYNDEYVCQLWIGVGISLLALGVVGTVIGAVLVAQGKRIKREALESKPQVSIAPLPRGEGAMASLRWYF